MIKLFFWGANYPFKGKVCNFAVITIVWSSSQKKAVVSCHCGYWKNQEDPESEDSVYQEVCNVPLMYNQY